MSVVEKTLRDDPGATYGRMDFATRDRHRHVVERLARRGKLDECDVARGALRLAREAAGEEGGDDIRAHVGYYLADAGVPRLERDLGLRRGPLASIRSGRSEEHTSELQSLMRISYAVFCLKKNKKATWTQHTK